MNHFLGTDRFVIWLLQQKEWNEDSIILVTKRRRQLLIETFEIPANIFIAPDLLIGGPQTQFTEVAKWWFLNFPWMQQLRK